MLEIYSVNGRRFEVSAERKQSFLNQYPNAVFISGTAGSSQDPSLKVNTQPDLFTDIFGDTWMGKGVNAFRRGLNAASTTGELNKMFLQGSQVTTENINNYIEAKREEAKLYQPSEKMENFTKKYNEKKVKKI